MENLLAVSFSALSAWAQISGETEGTCPPQLLINLKLSPPVNYFEINYATETYILNIYESTFENSAVEYSRIEQVV